MVLTSATDRLGNAAGGAVGAVSGRFADWVIRLGVTGLSRAGKLWDFILWSFQLCWRGFWHKPAPALRSWRRVRFTIKPLLRGHCLRRRAMVCFTPA